MFKHTINIKTADEVNFHLSNVDAALSSTGLSQEILNLLKEQIISSLAQIKNQFHRKSIFTINRTIEGKGYKVTIRASFKGEGTIQRLKRIIGL